MLVRINIGMIAHKVFHRTAISLRSITARRLMLCALSSCEINQNSAFPFDKKSMLKARQNFCPKLTVFEACGCMNPKRIFGFGRLDAA